MNNSSHSSNNLPNRFWIKTSITTIYLVIIVFFLFLPRLQDYFFQDNSLHIYAFSEFISFESIKEFEEKYGVEVSIKNFESNEELLTKFKITQGEGYDLITPSDYMVQLLQREGLLHKLDHTKLPVIKELDERLLNKYYDPGNQYSLPLLWVTYGIVFKKDIFKTIPEHIGFDLMFKQPAELPYDLSSSYKVCMVDDFIEAMFLSNIYTFGNVASFDDARLATIKKTLIAQKQLLSMYFSQDLRYYLFSEIFKVAITTSANMKRILEERDDFDFKIPKEGSLFVIENFAIPARCKKIDLVYKFLNFILEKKMAEFNSDMFGYNPSNKLAYASIEERFLNNPNFFPDEETFARLHLIHNDIPLKKFEEVWFEVKSS